MGVEMITISGNLGADPELKFTANGTAMVKLRVAITERTKQADGSWADGDTMWLDVIGWRQLAENAAESLAKGSRIIATGKLKSRSYEKNDGTKGVSYELVAEDIGPSLVNQAARLAKATPKNKVERGLSSIGAAIDDAWALDQPTEAPF
jgi:single-strand DNA-binding protein